MTNQEDMEARVKELAAELKPKIAARFYQNDLTEPLSNYATLAYYNLTPSSERNDETAAEFNKGPIVKKLSIIHQNAYSAHLALEELLSTGRFADSKDQFLNRDRFSNAYESYVEGRFGDSIALLDQALMYIGGSIFSAPHNIGPHNADIALIQKYAAILKASVEATKSIFQKIQEQSIADMQAGDPEKVKEYTIPESLLTLATNIANSLRGS